MGNNKKEIRKDSGHIYDGILAFNGEWDNGKSMCLISDDEGICALHPPKPRTKGRDPFCQE